MLKKIILCYLFLNLTGLSLAKKKKEVEQNTQKKRVIIRNILLSPQFHDPLFKGKKTLVKLIGKEKKLPILLKRESRFFFNHISLILENNKDTKFILKSFSRFLSYYAKLLNKYWNIRSHKKGCYTSEFSIELTVEVFKQENRFDKLSEFIDFIVWFEKNKLEKFLEPHKQYSFILLYSSLFYFQEFKKEELLNFEKEIS